MNKAVIAVIGKINSGKSTLVNSLAGEDVAIVSSQRGSTSDNVSKMTELSGVGRVQLIDTAGYDDDGTLSKQRLQRVKQAFDSADMVLVCCGDPDEVDMSWVQKCKNAGKQYLLLRNIFAAEEVTRKEGELWLDFAKPSQVETLRDIIREKLPSQRVDILGSLVGNGDVVLLCMPQDDGAPTDRLILPQSIVLRAILEKGAVPIIADVANFAKVYSKYGENAKLVITDSSVFDMVHAVVEGRTPITGFSVLLAKHNGDIEEFIRGAEQIGSLTDGDKVLIMEGCSHETSHKDIGSVVIPRLIKKMTNADVKFDFLRGREQPKDWGEYKLVVHCGGCMLTRGLVMSRIQSCKMRNVPITNYGVLIAKINGILDKIVY